MDQVKIEKLSEILQDENNVAKLQGKELADFIAELEVMGVSVTESELREFNAMLKGTEGELDEEALSNVAGGVNWKRWWNGVKYTAWGMLDGILGM